MLSNSSPDQIPTRPVNDRVAMKTSDLPKDVIEALRNAEPGLRSQAAEQSLRDLEQGEALIPR